MWACASGGTPAPESAISRISPLASLWHLAPYGIRRELLSTTLFAIVVYREQYGFSRHFPSLGL